jgi:hypothetical protein
LFVVQIGSVNTFSPKKSTAWYPALIVLHTGDAPMHVVAPGPPVTVVPEQLANVGEAWLNWGSVEGPGEERHVENSVAELKLSYVRLQRYM